MSADLIANARAAGHTEAEIARAVLAANAAFLAALPAAAPQLEVENLPVAVAPPAAEPVRNPDLKPLAELPRGTIICYDRKRAGRTLHAIYQGDTVEGADGVSYTSLSTWLKNALGYKTANGWEGTYVMQGDKKVWLHELRAAAGGGK